MQSEKRVRGKTAIGKENGNGSETHFEGLQGSTEPLNVLCKLAIADTDGFKSVIEANCNSFDASIRLALRDFRRVRGDGAMAFDYFVQSLVIARQVVLGEECVLAVHFAIS